MSEAVTRKIDGWDIIETQRMGAASLVTEFGTFEVVKSQGCYRLVGFRETADLDAESMDEAIPAASRIIAERCRETLRLLGESE